MKSLYACLLGSALSDTVKNISSAPTRLHICLLETADDKNQVIKWNMGKLYDLDPVAFKERGEEANMQIAKMDGDSRIDGPYGKRTLDIIYNTRSKTPVRNGLYGKRTLDAVYQLRAGVPARNRKRFLKWITDILDAGFNTLYEEPSLEEIHDIEDWINGAQIEAATFETLSFEEASREAQRWHYSLMQGNNDLQIKSNKDDIVFSWPDGWKIVKVPAYDCDAEGRAMGHCVGGYADNVKQGLTTIYSLRDSNDKPHATIEIQGDDVRQIKGKQNVVPISKYALRVVEWLATTSFSYFENIDYIKISEANDNNLSIPRDLLAVMEKNKSDVNKLWPKINIIATLYAGNFLKKLQDTLEQFKQQDEQSIVKISEILSDPFLDTQRWHNGDISAVISNFLETDEIYPDAKAHFSR